MSVFPALAFGDIEDQDLDAFVNATAEDYTAEFGAFQLGDGLQYQRPGSV